MTLDCLQDIYLKIYIFVETGHGLTDLIIGSTEFKSQDVANFELNSLMFPNYKNTQTGKALV